MDRISIKIRLSEGNKTIYAKAGEYALDTLSEHGISVYAPCGGEGRCGGCRAIIKGNIRADGNEKELLTDTERLGEVHLLCRTALLGDCEIDLRESRISAVTEGTECDYTLSPLAEGKYGFAADIGTTTVAVYLCDTENRKIVLTDSFANPQSIFGADVISRMSAIIGDKSLLSKQRDMIIGAINNSVQKLCEKLGTEAVSLCSAVICGNTVMEHIAAGLDPSGIAVAPFVTKSLFGNIISAKDAGFIIKPDAPVLFAPCVASYVGGDISCGTVAAGIDLAKDNVLYIDVGTNGEIGFSSEGKLNFCSAAAGPAFEGANIARGMAGERGAVDRVFIDGDGIGYTTIGGAPARGICGSGVLDAAAVMLDAGILDETGRITAESGSPFEKYVRPVDGKAAFVIDGENGIYITGADVRQIQLAKAAICAGAKVLVKNAGLKMNEIDRVIIAGGFGAHMNAESAVKIGLLPRIDVRRISSVGNAAGMGATALLMGEEPRRRAKAIRESALYTELSSNADFMEYYVDEMMFEA